MTLSTLAGSDAANKLHALQFYISSALSVMDNCDLTDNHRADQALIIAGLKQYVQGQIIETVEH